MDDVAIGITGTGLETPETVKNEMQNLSNKYDKYLFAAGGRLNLQKCLWYLIDFTRVKNKIIYRQEFDSNQYNLEVTEAFSKKSKTIQRLNPHQHHKSLGIFLAPDGNQKKEIEHLKEKVNIWSKMINGTLLYEKCVRWHAYQY